MGRQNKCKVDVMEMAKQDMKKHVNKDVKCSKLFFFFNPFYIAFLYVVTLITTVLILDLEVAFILQNVSVPNPCKLGYCNHFIVFQTPFFCLHPYINDKCNY